jgi:hypothetical protein
MGFASWCMTVLCSATAGAIPFVFYYYGAVAIPFVVLTVWINTGLDFLASEAPMKNYQIAKLNGFSTNYFIATTLWNYAFAFGGVWVIMALFIYGTDVYAQSYWITARNVLFCLAAVEGICIQTVL